APATARTNLPRMSPCRPRPLRRRRCKGFWIWGWRLPIQFLRSHPGPSRIVRCGQSLPSAIQNRKSKTQNRTMPATIYYHADADLAALRDKTIAIIGYGSQGHAQAQNLRDSGCKVIIGQRKGGANHELALSHGFQPMSAAEATQKADLVNILVPDELQG